MMLKKASQAMCILKANDIEKSQTQVVPKRGNEMSYLCREGRKHYCDVQHLPKLPPYAASIATTRQN